MDEEQLKELLGENYEGAQEFFKGKVLGGGDYVNKGKADAEKKELEQQLEEAKKQVQDRLSEEEKNQLNVKAKDDMIKQLQEQLLNNKIEANQSKAIGNVAEATTLIGVKTDDKDFTSFISNISTEDTNKTLEISKYVNKLVKDAYEKGKSEATKQNLSKIGNFNANSNDNGSSSENKESTATRLAKEFTNKKIQSNYFQN